ncbi:MAG: hypothetical protein AB7S81_04370 [Bdellovibrionales bacterium]
MLKPNNDLIKISTLSDAHKYPPVCVSEFVTPNHQLYYINAAHVNGLDNPTCQTIKRAFGLYNPKAVVVECGGCSLYLDGYKSYLLDHVKESKNADNECAYATLLGLERNLPIANGEPMDSVILKELLNAGYESKDVQAFFCLQWLGQEKERKNIHALSFHEKTTAFLQNQRRLLSLQDSEALTLPEYQRWFSRHYPERIGLLDISSIDTAPEESKKAHLAHRISYETNKVRDPHIVQAITKMLNYFNSVLVVCGAGHLETQRAVFEDMLAPCQEKVLAPTVPLSQTHRNDFSLKL